MNHVKSALRRTHVRTLGKKNHTFVAFCFKCINTSMHMVASQISNGDRWFPDF